MIIWRFEKSKIFWFIQKRWYRQSRGARFKFRLCEYRTKEWFPDCKVILLDSCWDPIVEAPLSQTSWGVGRPLTLQKRVKDSLRRTSYSAGPGSPTTNGGTANEKVVQPMEHSAVTASARHLSRAGGLYLECPDWSSWKHCPRCWTPRKCSSLLVPRSPSRRITYPVSGASLCPEAVHLCTIALSAGDVRMLGNAGWLTALSVPHGPRRFLVQDQMTAQLNKSPEIKIPHQSKLWTK